MAFTSSPVNDTYSSQRIPLVQSEVVDPISTANGLGLWNMMYNVLPRRYKNQAGEEGLITVTRPGIQGVVAPAGNTNAQVRGLYVWEKGLNTNYYFIVIGQSIYTTAAGPGGPYTAVSTFSTAIATPVRFTEFISSTNVKSLIVTDGIEAYVFTTNAAGTKIVDADFPTPHVPFPVFLNGRLYLAKRDTGDIYCSDLDDPAAWTAGNFVSSETYPDDIQALIKLDNYILSVGLVGCEYFYDAAIAIGSPLARIENSALPFGTDYQSSIATSLNDAVLLSKGLDGNTILRHISGFKHEEISCPFLNQLLPQVVVNTNLVLNVVGHLFRDAGELFYCLTLDYTKNSDTTGVCGLTFVYSFSCKMWVQFSRGADGNRTSYGDNAHKTYPVFFTAPGYGGSKTIVAGNAADAPFVGLLTENNRGIDDLFIASAVSSTIYPLSSVTLSNLTFGTMNRKFMSRLGVDYTNDFDITVPELVGNVPRVTYWDTPQNRATAVAQALPSGFYQNASVTTGGDFPFLTQLGTFRHRWIRVECYGALEYRYVEVDINKGQQ